MTESFELPPAAFARVASLFPQELPNRTMVFSTLAQRTPGQVFVDDPDAPTACLVKTNYYNWSFIGGVPQMEWLAAVLRGLHSRGGFFLTAHPLLDEMSLPAVPSRISERFAFDRRADDGAPIVLSAEFALSAMDAALFARAHWHDEIVLACGTAENFLRHGRGLCVLRGDEICSEAYAVFRGDGKFELGIFTAEPYRGRGLAYAACCALARRCEAENIPVYWSCDQKNFGSVATARKLGFQTEQPYRLVSFAAPSQTA